LEKTAPPDKKRLTRFGKFLSESRFDGLPGLWNVLKREMSLVGPRLLVVEYLPFCYEEQARRHEVRPGITGWAQVNGRNAISWDEKFEHDVWYVENQSFRLDLKILFLTVKVVFVRGGISQEGQASMVISGICNKAIPYTSENEYFRGAIDKINIVSVFAG